MLSACAAPGTGSPRLSFSQAMTDGQPPPDPAASHLVRSLDEFSRGARAVRARAQPGARVSEAHARAWTAVLSEVEGALLRSPAHDLVRARLVLQAELDADSGTWGDVPPALAERIVTTVRRLSDRLAVMPSRRRRADPATFLWPTQPVVVTSPWGDRLHPLHGSLAFHAGVDLGGELAQEVRAADSGTVLFAGWNGAHGKQLEVQHDAHLATRYSHLMVTLVKVGQHVRKGEVIGLMGETGAVTGPHLHFELRRDGDPLDPQALLRTPVLRPVASR